MLNDFHASFLVQIFLMKVKIHFWILIIVAGLSSCIPNKPNNNLDFSLDLKERDVQLAYEAAYNHSRDSLLRFFHHKNPTIRYIAVNAFASWQDTTAIDSIAPLLKDEDENVRVAAAYSLGQIRSLKAEPYLVSSFITFDSLNKFQLFNATVLEALGKCGDQNTLRQIASVKSYLTSDSLLLIGQARSIYRFALRDITLPAGTRVCLNLVCNSAYPSESRLYAANYLSRAKGVDLKSTLDSVINAYNQSNNRDIKLALATAISKTKTEKSLSFLKTEMESSQDQGIRYNLLSNLKTFAHEMVDTIAFQYLKDKNFRIARLAARYFIDNGNEIDAKKYLEYYFNPETNAKAHIEILGAANKYLPFTMTVSRTTVNDILKDSLLKVSDVYRKADIINALAYDVTNFLFIRNLTVKAPDKILQVTGLECFGSILGNPNFAKTYRSNYITYKKQIFSYLVDGILSRDVGLVSTAAVIMRDPALNFKNFLPSDSLFRIALTKQKLPENVEAYNELAKTISYWSGQPYKPAPDKGFRMLDWAVLNNISDSTLCEIVTTKGSIKMLLQPSLAPMTVANWIELVKRNYFNGKHFHRVVPNFVIQSGCNRGDGFGSMNYIIRSEYSREYYDKAGLVGMASAGPDTESSQFFITSAATPHLDGRYTIFAEVIEGMDIVESIQRGDKILKINIK